MSEQPSFYTLILFSIPLLGVFLLLFICVIYFYHKKNKTLLDKLNSLLYKLNVYNEKIGKFIPSGNKESLSNDFSDIQTDVVKMISELDSTHSKSSSTHSKSSSIHSKSSSTHSKSSSKSSEKKDDLTIQNTKIEDEIASLTTMLEMVSKREKPKIIEQIQELQQQLR